MGRIVGIALLLVATAIDDAGYLAPSQGSGTHGAAAPRRATTINTYTTTTNSYTFTGLATNKRYTYRVRAIGEENTYSQWSEEKTFEFGTTGIKQKTNSKQQAANIPIYNLSDQRVGANFKGLVVKESKKFMNK